MTNDECPSFNGRVAESMQVHPSRCAMKLTRYWLEFDLDATDRIPPGVRSGFPLGYDSADPDE
jgi:hypothetical protein